MNSFTPVDFEKVLASIRNKVSSVVECDDIRSIESNFNTKGMVYRSRKDHDKSGIIIVGEDDGRISVDIDIYDGTIRNFVLEQENDQQSISNIVGWIQENYK